MPRISRHPDFPVVVIYAALLLLGAVLAAFTEVCPS